MFFTLRCAFWLGAVFYALSWTGERAPAPVSAIIDQLGEHCTAAPAECLEAARKLTGLFERIALETGLTDGPQLTASMSPTAQTLRAADRTPLWRGDKNPAKPQR